MENYPILNEPGKGRYAIYFRLNERAVTADRSLQSPHESDKAPHAPIRCNAPARIFSIFLLRNICISIIFS